MRLLAWYFTTSFFKNYFVGLFALVLIHAFQAVMGQLIDNEFTFTQVLYYQALQMPEVAVQMTPPAILIATVFTLAGLNRTNELTACYSIGVGLPQIMTVFLSLVIIVCCLSLVVQDRILPPVFRNRTTYYWREMKNKPDFFLDVKQDKIWYRSNNLIYNLRTFDPKTKTIYGMAVYTFDEAFRLIQVLDAKRAEFTPRGWKLRDGVVTVFSGRDSFPLSQKFDEKELQITETPKDFMEIEKEVDGLRLRELHQYIERMKATGVDTKAFEVKLHAKLSLSFIPLVMCLLAVPFSIRNRREGSLAKDLGICMAFTFFYWLFYSIGLSLGKNGAVPPSIAAWLPSVLFLALALGLIAKRPA